MLPGNARSADRIDDDVDAAAARNVGNPLAEIVLLAIDHVLGAALARETRLRFAADNADDVETGDLSQIDQRVAHAAGRGIDEYVFPGAAAAPRR